jgi:cytochrome c oxidase subunit 2
MAAEAQRHPPAEEPNHWRRYLTLWILASLIVTPLVVVFVGPIMPPGHGSAEASSKVTDNTVLIGMATPVLLMVVVYLVYAIVYFRAPKGGESVAAAAGGGASAEGILEGPAVRGNARIQTTWIVITSALVLALAAYGTVRLVEGGAGGGQGPSPAFAPSGKKLPVQVIAQEWYFTYRYPTYGGVETTHLVLPVNQMVELHVTSLDVIHSFWALQLGVKADANPNVDNVAFVKPTKLQSFEIRCAELCGIWHGYMYDKGRVVRPAAFASWIREQQLRFVATHKYLPPYSTKYVPEPLRRGG